MSLLVLRQMLAARRRSTVWWAVGAAATAVTFASAYPSVADSSAGLEDYMDSLPDALVELFGAGAGIATPAGYLSSQLYANVFPILLLVLGMGAAAWSIAGAEGDGTLEMLLANPVSRVRVALERLLGVVLVTAVVTLVTTVVLVLVAPAFELDDLPGSALWAAGLGSWALALCFAGIAFGVGAATGSRGLALAVGSAVAAGTYVLYGITGFVGSLHWLHWASPWFWYLDADALGGASTRFWLQAVLLPTAVVALAAGVGIARFRRRDVGRG